jgi:hypothetical protein
MPQKYRILASHADAKPKAGRTTSNFPKKKVAKKAVKKKMGY